MAITWQHTTQNYLNRDTKVVAILYPGNEQLNPHLDLQRKKRKCKNGRLENCWKIAEIVCMCVWAGLDCFLFKCSSIKRRTVLHFSIRVRISGFTLSIRSTSWALHFNIPPGTARILEPTKVMSKQDYECQGLLHQVFNHSYVMSFQSSVCDRNV